MPKANHHHVRSSATDDNDMSSSIIEDRDGLNESVNKEDGAGAALCKLHPTKKIEAFCEKDFKLLCIDCILSDRHKNHEIISVAKAAERHSAYLRAQ